MDPVSLSPSESSTPVDSGKDASIGTSSTPMEYKPLFEHFGLTRPSDLENPKHNAALARIWEYAKSVAPNKDKDSILFEVMRLKSRLGNSGVENNPYLKVEMYVRAHEQAKEADRRMRELEASKE